MGAQAAFPYLLDSLGFTGEERISINWKGNGDPFSSRIIAPDQAPTLAASVAVGHDVWWGINPVHPAATGRGKVTDIVRWACLHADLDVKPGGMPSLDAAHDVVSDLSDMLGSQPVAVIHSGHGLQPYWAMDPADEATGLTDASRPAAVALLRRWGRLVARVAAAHGGSVDSVYDLTRVLRVPDTFNLKGQPLPVVGTPMPGRMLGVDELTEVLDAYAIPAYSTDGEVFGEQVAPVSGWTWAERTCSYFAGMVKGWATERPDARHPWLLAQLVRLQSAARHGCVTAGDHGKALTELAGHMSRLCATQQPIREVQPGEIGEALAWATEKVTTMSDDHLDGELGTHAHVPEVEHVAIPQPEESSSAPAEPSTMLLSEDGHAALFLAPYGDVVRYCVERGKWYCWNQNRWQIQWPEGMAREYAKRVARLLPEENREMQRFKQRCLSAQGTTGALRQAQVDPRVAVSINDFDSYARELNTPGGILDLAHCVLLPHDPAHMHTRVTTVSPDFAMPCPRWLEFLTETFGGDADLIAFVQRLVGYSFVGEVLEHILPFCFGTGGNGKGVFLETVMALLGDYAQSAPNNFLMSGQTRHETEIAALAGARMVVCTEINDDARFDEAKVKMLTGGDVLRGRFMHKDHFQFTPTHTLWLVGNADPETHIGGRSFERRLKKIPFDHEVIVPEIGLKERLVREEGPAIMAWIARGAADYFRDGLPEPSRVTEATQDYWNEQDTVGRFVAERCKLGGGEFVQTLAAPFRDTYENWCKRELGAEPVTPKALTQQLKRLGIGTKRVTKGTAYLGITILTSEDAEPDRPWQERF